MMAEDTVGVMGDRSEDFDQLEVCILCKDEGFLRLVRLCDVLSLRLTRPILAYPAIRLSGYG